MKYIGIDCSSKTLHIVMLGEDGNILEQIKLESKEKESEKKLRDLLFQFLDLCKFGKFDNNDIFLIEKAIYIQNFWTSLLIAQVVTMTKIILWIYNIKAETVDNRTWKAKCNLGLKGNSNKKLIKEVAIKKWGMDEKLDQDFYDAACIAYYNYEINKLV